MTPLNGRERPPRAAANVSQHRIGRRADRAAAFQSASRRSAGERKAAAQSSPTKTRRAFLQALLAAAGCSQVSLLGASISSQSDPSAPGGGLIDVNVNLARWPLRHLRGDDTPALAAMLRRHRVVQAWAGSFDGLLHKDLASVNARLAEECRRHGRGLLVPIGSINPKAPEFQEELRRCAEVHGMPGIRLHPNYHSYHLDDPNFARLLRLATERRLLVQLALVMEDERMMHPLLRVEPVDVAPLAEVVKQTPDLRLVLLNALRTLRGQSLTDLLAAGDVSVEISMLEGVGAVANLLAQVPPGRVLFGSHAPLFYFESARLKLQESPLDQGQLQAICRGNARRVLGR